MTSLGAALGPTAINDNGQILIEGENTADELGEQESGAFLLSPKPS